MSGYQGVRIPDEEHVRKHGTNAAEVKDTEPTLLR
jgi:hypothetical protein